MKKFGHIFAVMGLLAGAGCTWEPPETTAAIRSLEEHQVVVDSNYTGNEKESTPNTILNEGQRGCEIAKPGSKAVWLSYKCGKRNVTCTSVYQEWNNTWVENCTEGWCEHYEHLFGCQR